MGSTRPDCARCDTFVCRRGHPELAPANCPMRGAYPSFEELYSDPEVRHLVSEAARIESGGYCRWSRVREVIEFARLMGWQRLGIACAPDTRREAALAARRFLDAGLEVTLPGDSVPMSAAERAARMAEADTQLNVVAGLPVAAEAVFLKTSRAPVTSLVARDLALQHNPVAALYTRRSYYRKKLRIPGPPRSGGSARSDAHDLETLQRAEAAHAGEGESPVCRVVEAMQWAASLGMRRLGVSFCIGFRNEARILVSVLEDNGFETVSVCCKSGAVPKERMGLEDSEKVRPGEPEMICNSVGQGKLLSRAGADAVFILGQCVGHDSATLDALEPPGIVLVAKDRVYAHNSVAPLYAMEGP